MRRAWVAFLLAGCGGDWAAGVDAYREGRFEDAHAALVRAEEAGGTSDALRLDRALAALRAGDLRDAEAAAERAGTTRASWRAFLRGSIAFARCVQAERQAQTPLAEPFAFDVAIRHGETAREFWEQAAMGDDDWPAARRNVERAVLKLRDLRRQKAQKEDETRKESDPEVRLRPDERAPPLPPPPPENPPEAEQGLELTESELGPEQVQALLRTLAEKEREKRAVRRAAQREQAAPGERDW